MQKNILSAFSLFLAFLLVSCGNDVGGSQDPKAVTKNFIEALGKGDMDGAAKYATRESQGTFTMMKVGLEMAKNQGKSDQINEAFAEFQGKKISYTDPKIDGETASVTVTMDERQGLPILLKKQDGEWKVMFDIGSIMESKMKSTGQNNIDTPSLDSGLNQLGKDADSARKILNEHKGAIDSLKKLGGQ